MALSVMRASISTLSAPASAGITGDDTAVFVTRVVC